MLMHLKRSTKWSRESIRKGEAPAEPLWIRNLRLGGSLALPEE